MQSGSEAEPGGQPEAPRGGAADLRRTINADMESIFRLLPRTSQPESSPSVTGPGAKRSAYLWQITLVVLVAASLLAAAWVFLPGVLHPRRAATAAPSRPIAMMAMPIPAEIPTPPSEVTPPSPPTAASEQAPRSPEPRAKPATQPRAAAQPSRRARQTAREAAASPARRCDDQNSAWCMRERTVAADGALRDAYAQAVRAGVARDSLVDIRRDWQRLRKRSNKDPSGMIDGYADLTGTLRRLTRERTGR